jgi:hypothetical protein
MAGQLRQVISRHQWRDGGPASGEGRALRPIRHVRDPISMRVLAADIKEPPTMCSSTTSNCDFAVVYSLHCWTASYDSGKAHGADFTADEIQRRGPD